MWEGSRMTTLHSIFAALGGSFVFWAAWIVIPLIMEIVPAIGSLFLLIRRRVRVAKPVESPALAPKITLIIPVYNSADSLGSCIRSVAESTYPDASIRIFAVNNHSTDESFQVFARCQEDFPGLTMQWMNAEQGKSRALNMALFNSAGKYVVNIDSDGVLEPHALKNLVDRFEADPSMNVATGVILTDPDLIEKYPRGRRRLFRKLEFIEYAQAFLAGRNFASEINYLYTLSGAFTAFRSSAILASWLYNTDTICEDTQITFQMRYRQHERLHVCENAVFLADPIESVDKLYTQRQRWQRGSLEVANMFGGEDLSLKRALRDVNVNTLLYDHTFAFPRMIWYIALICLLAVGYSGKVVLSALGVIYVLYVACGYFYFAAASSFLGPFPTLRRYYRRQWWLIPMLPAFNFAVFFIRLAGVVNSIGTDSAWRTRTLTEERSRFGAVVRRDGARLRAAMSRARAAVNDESKDGGEVS